MLDGNALFLSGYTRNITIANSSFSFIGDNAVAAWGYTKDLPDREGHRLPEGTGIDGTGGDQPRFTQVRPRIVPSVRTSRTSLWCGDGVDSCFCSTVPKNLELWMCDLLSRPALNVLWKLVAEIDAATCPQMVRNVVREIGMNERQSSAWSEAKACQNHVEGNLFYNMPRAAINRNDGGWF